MYRYRRKKEKPLSSRIDRFLLAVGVVLLALFLATNLLPESRESALAELLVSTRYKKLLGDETANALALEFLEQHPGLQIRFTDEEADVLLFAGSELQQLIHSGELGAEPLVIPLVSHMDMLFYNIDVLRAAGFDRPPRSATEFVTWARSTSGTGAAGFAMALNPQDRDSLSRDIFSWIWAAGGNFWNFERGASLSHEARPVINSPVTVSVLFFLRELYREGVMSPHIFTKTGAEMLEDFAQGRVAMMIASTREIPFLREKMGGDTFGFTSIPGIAVAGAGGLARSGIELSYIYAGIRAESESIEAARDFIAFLAEKNQFIANRLEAVPGVIPGSPAGFAFGQHIAGDFNYLRAWDIFESSQIVYGFSRSALADEFEESIRDELYAFFEGRQNATATAAFIQNRWDDIYTQGRQ
ncbi:MAG: extracellular solute-binding protein [Spirochaetes bacterium]|nr:extracellular solute-binding protein [Spirochaetota bacterium]